MTGGQTSQSSRRQDRLLDTWLRTSLGSSHDDILTDRLPEEWLAMIGRAERRSWRTVFWSVFRVTLDADAGLVLDPTMRAAVIQFEAGAERAANIARASSLIALAAAGGTLDLICLPEMWTCLGGNRTTKVSQSETLPMSGGKAESGTAYAFLQEAARRHGVAIHGGSLGERDGETLYNTTVLFDAGGTELARYRKIHLFDVITPTGQGYRESALFGAGDAVVTAQLGRARLGLTICYDLRFPELFLALRQQGADVILVPSAFTAETGRDHWEALLRARAIETQCWVVAAATTGRHRDARGQPRTTWGHSMIIDPWGTVQAAMGQEEGFSVATLDFARSAQIRAAMPVLEHRRLDRLAQAQSRS